MALFSILACATCYGDPNSSQTQGMNYAILVMLGVTALVLSGVAGIMVHFVRRARQSQTAGASDAIV
jgi:heme/copper-type cytochrome/quinol oxidase subunit 2